MNTIQTQHFTNALLRLLRETFDINQVGDFFLDTGTSLSETLAHITAAEASMPIGGKCATLATQVKHVAFYFSWVEQAMHASAFPQVDWNEVWNTVGEVTPDEWQSIQQELHAHYERIVNLIKTTPNWSNEVAIGSAMAAVVHTAYHLGEIRQALCMIQSMSPRAE